jgi:hypothetical protein
VLVQALIRERRYVCDDPRDLAGKGPSPRGRYASVRCENFTYRIELWADKETFDVRPWIEGAD